MKSKIAFIQRKISTYGGGGIFALRFIREMHARGHQISILTDSRPPAALNDVTFLPVPILKPFSFLKMLSFARFSQIIARKNKFNLIFSNERTLYHDIYFAGEGCHRAWLRQRFRQIGLVKKFLILINPLHLTILYLEKRCLRSPRLRGVIAFSNRTREELVEEHNLPPEKIKVVYHGAPSSPSLTPDRTTLRRDLGIAENEIVILYIGTGFERKGLRYLIEGLAHFDSPSFRLMVVGKGPIEKYRHLAQRLGLEARVHFYGPNPNAPLFYSIADIFVLPTLYEPFGLVVLEAMSFGVPVLVSQYAGAAELIDDGKSGLLIQNPFDPVEIGNHLNRMKSPEFRSALAEGGRELVARHTQEKNTQEIILAADELIAER